MIRHNLGPLLLLLTFVSQAALAQVRIVGPSGSPPNRLVKLVAEGADGVGRLNAEGKPVGSIFWEVEPAEKADWDARIPSGTSFAFVGDPGTTFAVKATYTDWESRSQSSAKLLVAIGGATPTPVPPVPPAPVPPDPIPPVPPAPVPDQEFAPLPGPVQAILVLPNSPTQAIAAMRSDETLKSRMAATNVNFRVYAADAGYVQSNWVKKALATTPPPALLVWRIGDPVPMMRTFPAPDATAATAAIDKARAGTR